MGGAVAARVVASQGHAGSTPTDADGRRLTRIDAAGRGTLS